MVLKQSKACQKPLASDVSEEVSPAVRECVCVELKVMTGTAVTPLFWWPSSITVASPKAPAHTSWARHSSPWQHTHTHTPEWAQALEMKTDTHIPCALAQNGKVWHHKYKHSLNDSFMSSRNLRGRDRLHNRMKIWMLLTWVTWNIDMTDILSILLEVCECAVCNAQQKPYEVTVLDKGN